MKWLTRFWNEHGDRIIFMLGATCFGGYFYAFTQDMQGEGKTILIGVAMLLFNKARTSWKDEGEGK